MSYSGEQGEEGLPGCYGPNDTGYMACALERIAHDIITCCEFWNGYSHHRELPRDHSYVKMMDMVRELYREACPYANKEFDDKMFQIPERCFKTPDEVWSTMKGV